MADRLTIARPYARAAFAEARGHERLEPWSETLRVAAEVVRDPRVRRLLGNPRVTPEQLAQLVSGIAGTQLGREGAHFVRMLAVNRRLGYLPEICALIAGRYPRRRLTASMRTKFAPSRPSCVPAMPLTSCASCSGVTRGFPSSLRTRGSRTTSAATRSVSDQGSRRSWPRASAKAARA